MPIKILCEDSEGIPFFKELVRRLKDERLVANSMGVDVAKFYGACNGKVDKIIKATEHKYERIVIVSDCDGKPIDEVEPRITKHVPKEYTKAIRLVLLRYEIEDWLFVSDGKSIPTHAKPSKVLKDTESYEKHMLQKKVSILVFDKLKKCESFTKFLDALNR